jgi:hypothetical protein
MALEYKIATMAGFPNITLQPARRRACPIVGIILILHMG